MVKILGYEAEMLENCPVCGAKSGKPQSLPLNENDFIDICICQECESMYHNPRMTRESMDEYYRSGDYIVAHKHTNIGERSRALKRVALLLQLGGKEPVNITEPTRALDVGCAEGHLLARIKDWSPYVETVGYDLISSPYAIREVVTDKNKIIGTFDFISCLHVLEHVYDPFEEIEWMNSLLDDQGILMIEIPISRCISAAHPITFSAEKASMLMDHINMRNYYTIATPEVYIFIGRKVVK